MNKETILIVDDNRQLADFLAEQLLNDMGYHAVAVYTGQSALEKIRATAPSLMLLDLELPDTTGLDFLRRLDQEGYQVPTVLFTAHGSEQVAAEAFRLGVQDYLIKPVEPAQLEAAITRALAETRLRAEAARLTTELKERVEWLSALSKVGRTVTSSLEVDDVLRRIVDAAVTLTQAEEGFLALLDHASGQFYLRAVKNLDEKLIQTMRIPVKDSMIGEAVRSGRPVRQAADAGDSSLKISTGFLVHSLLYVPIFSRGRPLGVLAVDNRSGRQRFSTRDEVMLTSLVDYAAVALENASLYEKARREISERQRVEKALRDSEERYALAALGANDGIWDWALKDNRVYYSPRWKNMLGFEDYEIGSDPQEWFSRVHSEDLPGLQRAIAAHLHGSAPQLVYEYRIRNKAGGMLWMLCRGIAVRSLDGSAGRIAGSQTDITLRVETEARLRHDAFTDGLTGLPNRAAFIEQLYRVIQAAQADPQREFAVLFLDLDRFKYINDSLGHPAGDELLVTVAGLLKTQLQPTDQVARLGGDEFVILLDGLKDATYAAAVSQRIIDTLSSPIYLEKYEASVSTSASFGIVHSSLGYTRPDDILRDADIAMYAAKAAGKGVYAIFDPSMRERILRRVVLEVDLQQAVQKNELQVIYQPVLSLSTGLLSGFEALVQWYHPVYGLLPAAEFVPLAQETGLIFPIDWWVFEEACRQAQEWQKQFPIDPPLQIQVNLTSSLMARPDLLGRIRQILEKTGLERRTLKLEISESMVSSAQEQVARIIHALGEMGIGVQIDNFGVGAASLMNLKRFPISGLKIDSQFVHEIDGSRDGELIAHTIVTLAHQLHLPTTAQGVESAAQLQALRRMGCDFGQGFLFSSALVPEETISLLEKRQRGHSLI